MAKCFSQDVHTGQLGGKDDCTSAGILLRSAVSSQHTTGSAHTRVQSWLHVGGKYLYSKELEVQIQQESNAMEIPKLQIVFFWHAVMNFRAAGFSPLPFWAISTSNLVSVNPQAGMMRHLVTSQLGLCATWCMYDHHTKWEEIVADNLKGGNQNFFR